MQRRHVPRICTHLRCAFNSLFEMRVEDGVGGEVASRRSFNSLFEMQISID